MPFVARFKQASGGGGREWLSNWFFQAGKWSWWWALMLFVVHFEPLPLRLAFQAREGRSKGVAVVGVSNVVCHLI